MQNIVKDWRMQGYKIAVFGVVQGVGFRPFVCVLARRFGLKGYVKNLGNNIEIVLQIPLQTPQISKIPRSPTAPQDLPPKIPAIIARFTASLEKNAPAPARIDKITLEALESGESSEVFLDFSILESAQSSQNLAKGALPNDVAICESCRRDLRNPRDRRHFYAFLNCAFCGPRYTIISALPFDRAHTAMRGFRMCESCQGEYEDSRDRRFHAQSVSCPRCGISVALFDRFGALVAGGKIAAQSAQSAESSQFAAIKIAQKLINRGEILAFKGVGGFNLIAKVDFDAIVRLRVRKNRPKKPFAIMFRDLVHLRRYFEPSREEIAALTASAAPIVLLSKRTLKRPLPPNLAPNMPTVGVILAYSPLHLLLFCAQKSPIIFTSANLSSEPIITAKNAVFTKLGSVFDYLFDFEREILNPIDDSLCAILANGKPLLLRAARGFYPLNLSLNLGANLKTALSKTSKSRQNSAIIALGAHQKSQIALFCDDSLIISPFIGDLEGLESVELFAKTIEFFLKIYDLKPEIVLADAHPQYFSSRFALELAARFGADSRQIFHHRAHFYAAMLEAGLLDSPRKILGVIFDGTGLGEDGAIWGGEFFVRESGGQSKNDGQKARVRRILHFKYFPIIGALSEERDNKKIAVGILQSVVGSEVLGLIRGAQNYLQIFQKNLNCHQSSSVGRIFDFVAFFCGLERQSFEGESGLFLENLYDESVTGAYDFKIEGEEIALDAMFVAIANESLGGALGGESSGDAAANLGAESWADSPDSQDLQDSSDSPRGESVGRDLGGEKIRQIRAQIASKFFNTLVLIITQVALREGAAVVFSGGVFQNKTLCNAIIRAFEREKIEFYMHEKLPPNDGNIAAGQITAFLFDS